MFLSSFEKEQTKRKREISPKVLNISAFKTFIWETEDCQYWTYLSCFLQGLLLTMGNLFMCLFLIILKERLYRQGIHFHFPCCLSTSPNPHKLWVFLLLVKKEYNCPRYFYTEDTKVYIGKKSHIPQFTLSLPQEGMGYKMSALQIKELLLKISSPHPKNIKILVIESGGTYTNSSWEIRSPNFNQTQKWRICLWITEEKSF